MNGMGTQEPVLASLSTDGVTSWDHLWGWVLIVALFQTGLNCDWKQGLGKSLKQI